MHQAPPSLFNHLAPKLRENGWRPLPGYQDTKRPSINGWNRLCDFQWTDEEFREVMLGRGKTEGKMVCLAMPSTHVAIDMDIEDEATFLFVFEKARDHLGDTPLQRIGRYPRHLFVYRSDGSVKSRKHHPIEIFSGSGQFVCNGYHVGAKKDYEWPIKSPSDLTVDDPSIPIISQQQIDDFLEACKPYVQFKTTPAKEYVESLFLGDTLIKDRGESLNKIRQEADVLAKLAEGSRNEQLFHLSYIAGQAMAAGLVRLDEVETIILTAAESCGLLADDQTSVREVRQTMRSGFKSGADAPFFVVSNWFEPPETPYIEPPAPTLESFTFDSDTKFTFPPSLIKGILPRNGVAFLGGQSGAGKTFLVCDIAIALTTQQAFFGHKVKEKVGVLILAGEGAETIQPRITVARMARNVDRPLPIAWMSNVPNLADPNAAQTMLPLLKQANQHFKNHYGVRLGAIVLDTLAATFLLQDENDNSEAAKIIKVMQNISQSLDCLVLPVHHYGKGAETGLRGASAWRAGSDAVLSVTAERNHLTGIVSEHRLWLAKSRVGEEGPVGDFALRTMLLGTDEDGDELTSCYVVPEVARKPSVSERREAEAVALEILGGGEWRADPRSEHWAGVAIAEAFDLDLTNKTQLAQVKSILKRLIAEDKLSEQIRNDETRRPRKYIMSVAPVAAPVQKEDILSDDFSVFD